MGGAASIESAHTLDIDYSTFKSSGIDFVAAYRALDNRIQKGKSANLGDVSIPFLAIRQLSKNLRNQESLERTKRKVLKSRSVPNNIKFKDSLDFVAVQDENNFNDDLNHTDLAIIPDTDLGIVAAEERGKVKRAKPNLSLQVANDFEEPIATILEKNPHQLPKANSPTAKARISPSGAFQIGKIKVLETGIEKIDSFNFTGSFSLQDLGRQSTKKVHIAADTSLPAIGGKKEFIEIAALGTGATGVVSEAIHIPSLTIVALKMLPIYNQEKRRQVSRELAILCKNLSEMHLLNDSLVFTRERDQIEEDSGRNNRCDNILSLYNAFVDPKSGLINLVIEYMDGGSLEDLVKQGGCKDEQVLADIARQTLNGLVFLHRNKSVHRDIKPANILCSSSGIIKIADFGISKILDQTSGFANSFVGTVCYMSPERITGDSYNYSSDVWSFGLTLLAVAKGRFPIRLSDFESEGKSVDDLEDCSVQHKVIGGPKGYWAMIQAICDERPPSAGDDFTPSFNTFIDSCLRKRPDERLTAKELLQIAFVTDNLRSPRHPASIFKPGANRDVQIEETEEFHEFGFSDLQSTNSVSSEKILPPEDEGNIINAIRLEHLDRLLDRISDKLKLSDSKFQDSKAHTPASTSVDSTEQMFLVSEERVQNSSDHREEHWDDDRKESATKTAMLSKLTAGSVRSVHFQDDDEFAGSRHLKAEEKKGAVTLRSRANLRALELQIPEDEGDVSRKLPKPSSYFLSTVETSDRSFDVPKGLVENIESTTYYEELQRLLPRLDESGLPKWKRFASQLNLPVPLVLLAVKSKLGDLIDLNDV